MEEFTFKYKAERGQYRKLSNISANLKKSREDANLRQKDLAEKIGVCQATIGDYEKGMRNIPIHILFYMAIIFKKKDIRDFLTPQ